MAELLKAEYGQTPLHRAARGNNHREVKKLLARRAKVNAKDQHGQTPLHYAAVANGTKSAELLLARGAKVDIKNTFNDTPLDLAKGNMKKTLSRHRGNHHRKKTLSRHRGNHHRKKTLSRHRGNHQSQGLQRGRRDSPSELGQITKVIRKELGPVQGALLQLTEAMGEKIEGIEQRQNKIEQRQDNAVVALWLCMLFVVPLMSALIFSCSQ